MSRLPARFSTTDVSRIFDFGRNPRARTTPRNSIASGRALLQSAFSSRKSIDGGVSFNDDACYADGSSKPIMSFSGGATWRHLEVETDELALDLFWPTKKESPFRPSIMPVQELSPLCNFRNLRSLTLTGMLRSYQPYIWQTVWLNPGLEELGLEMALEPCIRRTFDSSWPAIKSTWYPKIANQARGLYL